MPKSDGSAYVKGSLKGGEPVGKEKDLDLFSVNLKKNKKVAAKLISDIHSRLTLLESSNFLLNDSYYRNRVPDGDVVVGSLENLETHKVDQWGKVSSSAREAYAYLPKDVSAFPVSI